MGDVPDPEVAADSDAIEPDSSGPSRVKLAVVSLAAFAGLVVVGGLIGWLTAPGDAAPRAAVVVADVPASNQSTALAADEPAVFEPVTVEPEQVVDVEEPTPENVPDEPVNIEVLGVTELGLDLTAPATTVALAVPADVEFVELPKAVYDTFVLNLGESLAINIAANDKIGGQFEAVRPTGLGELAPGLTLEPNGVLSGIATECGRWRLQYALESDNPAIGTSWIDITVEGCDQLG